MLDIRIELQAARGDARLLGAAAVIAGEHGHAGQPVLQLLLERITVGAGPRAYFDRRPALHGARHAGHAGDLLAQARGQTGTLAQRDGLRWAAAGLGQACVFARGHDDVGARESLRRRVERERRLEDARAGGYERRAERNRGDDGDQRGLAVTEASHR